MHEGDRRNSVYDRGDALEILVDDVPVKAHAGESIAAALVASGRMIFRRTRSGAPRGPYCGMGICFECVMVVDGHPNVRTCQTLVRAGMRIHTQHGAGDHRLDQTADPEESFAAAPGPGTDRSEHR